LRQIGSMLKAHIEKSSTFGPLIGKSVDGMVSLKQFTAFFRC
jgi:hypothetical protein